MIRGRCSRYRDTMLMCSGLVLIMLLIWLLCARPAKTQVPNAAPNQVEINAQVAYGLGYQSNTVLMNYIEPGTTTAQFNETSTVRIPPNAMSYPVNLEFLFPGVYTPILWGIKDVSNPGQTFNLGMCYGGGEALKPRDTTPKGVVHRFGSNALTIAPGGFMIARCNGGFPTFYVDNPSSTQYVLLQVFCLAN